jgi:cytochrome c peroxidase
MRIIRDKASARSGSGRPTALAQSIAAHGRKGGDHNLRTERFFEPTMINGRMASTDGPIKTFPLRGIKDSPTYLHDGRLLTLEDTVEFFNIVLGLELSERDKADLTAFMRVL